MLERRGGICIVGASLMRVWVCGWSHTCPQCYRRKPLSDANPFKSCRNKALGYASGARWQVAGSQAGRSRASAGSGLGEVGGRGGAAVDTRVQDTGYDMYMY